MPSFKSAGLGLAQAVSMQLNLGRVNLVTQGLDITLAMCLVVMDCSFPQAQRLLSTVANVIVCPQFDLLIYYIKFRQNYRYLR